MHVQPCKYSIYWLHQAPRALALAAQARAFPRPEVLRHTVACCGRGKFPLHPDFLPALWKMAVCPSSSPAMSRSGAGCARPPARWQQGMVDGCEHHASSAGKQRGAEGAPPVNCQAKVVCAGGESRE